jgi:hypothetical protein
MNLVFLNDALRLTDWNGRESTPENWRQQIAEKLGSIDSPS